MLTTEVIRAHRVKVAPFEANAAMWIAESVNKWLVEHSNYEICDIQFQQGSNITAFVTYLELNTP